MGESLQNQAISDMGEKKAHSISPFESNGFTCVHEKKKGRLLAVPERDHQKRNLLKRDGESFTDYGINRENGTDR